MNFTQSRCAIVTLRAYRKRMVEQQRASQRRSNFSGLQKEIVLCLCNVSLLRRAEFELACLRTSHSIRNFSRDLQAGISMHPNSQEEPPFALH